MFPLRFMLESQLSRCEQTFKNALMISSASDRHKRRHHLEGTLSDMWQAYCNFIRQLVIRSSTGCTSANGVVYTASIVPANWQRASYIASRAAKGKLIQPGLVNSVMRLEPTWGDTNKIIAIISALNPGNANTLKS
ncbi:MAG: hypothetical protein Q8J70_01135, partial [Thiobacillus sp.]|nr:hypothetical protein [Thiobacillus sp.]